MMIANIVLQTALAQSSAPEGLIQVSYDKADRFALGHAIPSPRAGGFSAVRLLSLATACSSRSHSFLVLALLRGCRAIRALEGCDFLDFIVRAEKPLYGDGIAIDEKLDYGAGAPAAGPLSQP
jgi:hypothetical protein